MKCIMVRYWAGPEDVYAGLPEAKPIRRRYAPFHLDDGVSSAHLDEISFRRALGEVAP
jgi:hypothetical protein